MVDRDNVPDPGPAVDRGEGLDTGTVLDRGDGLDRGPVVDCGEGLDAGTVVDRDGFDPGTAVDFDRGLAAGTTVDCGDGLDPDTATNRGVALDRTTAVGLDDGLDSGNTGANCDTFEIGSIAAVSFPPASVAMLLDSGGEEFSVRVRHTMDGRDGLLSGATRISEVSACCRPAEASRSSGPPGVVLKSETVEVRSGSTTAERGETLCRANGSSVCVDSRWVGSGRGAGNVGSFNELAAS
jgi:hypothetical protein